MSKPSITNCPNTFFIIVHSFSCWLSIESRGTVVLYYQIQFACVQIRHNPLSGGYCGEVPPLPIPNREVKLTCADGTAMQCGRVGSRLLLSRASDFERFLRLFCFHAESFFFSRWLFFRSRRFRSYADFRPVRSGISQIFIIFAAWIGKELKRSLLISVSVCYGCLVPEDSEYNHLQPILSCAR